MCVCQARGCGAVVGWGGLSEAVGSCLPLGGSGMAYLKTLIFFVLFLWKNCVCVCVCVCVYVFWQVESLCVCVCDWLVGLGWVGSIICYVVIGFPCSYDL